MAARHRLAPRGGVLRSFLDAPGGGGKIPVNPNYVVEHDEKAKKWVLRNFRKQQFTYFEPK